jgi:glycosyltransferase involved in cell wall biosynthesis
VIADPRHESREARVSCFPPPLDGNPYQRLLYQHLDAEGYRLVRDPSVDEGWLRFRWLWRNRRSIDVLHIHWPQGLWRHRASTSPLERAVSWLKLGALAVRLPVARALGYTVAWTVHQVSPHEGVGRLDRAGARVLARNSHVLLVHDADTGAEVRDLDPRAAERTRVVEHGNYFGVYPPGHARDAVREQLGLRRDTFVFLCFGELRSYKGVRPLLDAFRAADIPDSALVIAGRPYDEATTDAIRAAADEDPRIVPRLGFVPDDEVAELFGAADAAVLARRPGTSGSLVLALSLGVPAIAPSTPAYEELLHSDAGWTFGADVPGSLAAALRAAAADPDRVSRRSAALERAAELDWLRIARRTARHFDHADGRPARPHSLAPALENHS